MDSASVVLSVHVDVEVSRRQCLSHHGGHRKTRQSLQVSYREPRVVTCFTSQSLKKMIGIIHQVLKTRNVERFKQNTQSLFVMRFTEEAALQAFLCDGKYSQEKSLISI